MKYDTTPLSIDTAGVDLISREQEVRFVPADGSNALSEQTSDSGPISQQTVIAKPFGFDTFIETRPETSKLERVKEKLSSPKTRSWALTALLASASAFGGGFAVYWVSSDRLSVEAVEPSPAVSEPQTEIRTSDTFVTKAAADSAAGEPPITQSTSVAAGKDRPPAVANVNVPIASSAPNDQLAVDGPPHDPSSSQPSANSSNTAAIQQPEREAKVGGYVVEKPAGQKPLARCADGTYSYSASKSAACAGRGGVGEWIGDAKVVPAKPAKQAAYVLGPRGGCYYLDGSGKKIYVDKKYCEQ